MSKQSALAMSFLLSVSALAGESHAATAHHPATARPHNVVRAPSADKGQLELVRNFMISQGQETFLILDKQHAQMVAFNNGVEIMRVPALFGSGDDSTNNAFTTPVGSFNLKVVASDNGTFIKFLCPVSNVCLTIHSTTSASREARYGKAGMADASAGCINLQSENYEQLAAFVKLYDEQGMQIHILPEDGRLDRIRSIFGIPDEFGQPVTVPSAGPALKAPSP
jgi:hypothetical protein